MAITSHFVYWYHGEKKAISSQRVQVYWEQHDDNSYIERKYRWKTRYPKKDRK